MNGASTTEMNPESGIPQIPTELIEAFRAKPSRVVLLVGAGMNTDERQITVGGLKVQVVRKPIKNLHLGVYQPSGRVRVAAPHALSDDSIRLAVVGKIGWIKRQRSRFQTQPRQSQREMVSGESHYFLGRRYRLRVIPVEGAAHVRLRSRSRIELHVRDNTTPEQREQALQRWYRQELRKLIPALLEKWQTTLGVHATDCGIKRMKTKWGACNIEARRIWLNLE